LRLFGQFQKGNSPKLDFRFTAFSKKFASRNGHLAYKKYAMWSICSGSLCLDT
jgi:hypothetical protein